MVTIALAAEALEPQTLVAVAVVQLILQLAQVALVALES